MTLIIAEAGTGHAGENSEERYAKALLLIEAASWAGADMVKFQAFFDEPLFCPVNWDMYRWLWWRLTFLDPEQWLELQKYAKKNEVDLILSVFSDTGIKLLKEMKPRYVKVASRAAAKFPYDELDGPFLISTGMGRPPDHIKGELLQCASVYPSPIIPWDGVHAGLSDHSGRVWPGMDAIFRGAKFLEVHFTTPEIKHGRDEDVCLSQEELKLLCEARDAAATMHGNIGWVEKADTGTS